MVLAPLPFLFPMSGKTLSGCMWQLVAALVAMLSCWACAMTLYRKPKVGKLLGILAVSGSYLSAWSWILNNPFIALSATVLFIAGLFFLLDKQIKYDRSLRNDHVCRCRERAAWGIQMIPLVVVIQFMVDSTSWLFPDAAVAISILTSYILYIHWAYEMKSPRRILLATVGLSLIIFVYFTLGFLALRVTALVMAIAALLTFPKQLEGLEKMEHWWEVLLSHPARILLTTFTGLCVLGTLLLSLPMSTTGGSIDLVDASFTSVSAVCVTGLAVLDTPNDFTLFGQFCLLLLIQLGGLGIMSITTVALQAMGRRLSLKQERLLTVMTDTDHKDLVKSLKTILKFTFLVEGVGALLLCLFFFFEGDSFLMACWRGIFTSISAFCNAGFALQSDSLVGYQGNAFILHTVAMLIVLGGMAPAISLLVPRWISRKPIPIPARIALKTTVILLVLGTLCMMIFEWNGVLAGLSIVDKIHNAWFQSVTLRTAGFNSVDIAPIIGPTFLVMVVFMFIGGSPGGTAGGVKTTTIGILAMTFWANITNRNEIITQNKRIHFSTVYRAITIVVSGIIIWLIVVLMLEVTQQISARELIFEATSAIGTVGLSIGASAKLDEIGKIIVIIAMFAGRIGPMTLFMLLSEEQSGAASRCPDEKISLT